MIHEDTVPGPAQRAKEQASRIANRKLEPVETCKWYVSFEQPECGDPAPYRVLVRGKVTKATVPLCNKHKGEHDRNFAAIRAQGRTA